MQNYWLDSITRDGVHDTLRGVLDLSVGYCCKQNMDWTSFSIGEEREIILYLGMLARHTIWHAPQFWNIMFFRFFWFCQTLYEKANEGIQKSGSLLIELLYYHAVIKITKLLLFIFQNAPPSWNNKFNNVKKHWRVDRETGRSPRRCMYQLQYAQKISIFCLLFQKNTFLTVDFQTSWWCIAENLHEIKKVFFMQAATQGVQRGGGGG